MKTKALHALVILALVIVALGVMPAPVAYAATFTVTNFLDTSDAAPGDGICADGAGQCTLRAAVEESDALAGADQIYVSPGVYQLTTGAPLQISDPAGTYIFNNGLATQADAVTIDGLGGTQVFYVLAGGTAHFKALNITRGNSGFGGGGIYNSSSATLLVMDNVTFHENQAASGDSLYNANANPNYVYDDVNVKPGTTYTYMLEDVSVNGQATMHGPVSVAVSEMPTAIEVRTFSASRAAAWLPTFVLVFGAASLAWIWQRKRH